MRSVYLAYMEKVLGVSTVLMPLVLGTQGDLKLKILVRSAIANGEAKEERALIEKMLQAMKLEAGQVIWMTDAEDSHSELPVLAFGDSDGLKEMTPEGLRPLGEWFVARNSKVFKTHDPRLLLQKPEMKKETWEHLKTVMRIL
jgi:hypothetical protein